MYVVVVLIYCRTLEYVLPSRISIVTMQKVVQVIDEYYVNITLLSAVSIVHMHC